MTPVVARSTLTVSHYRAAGALLQLPDSLTMLTNLRALGVTSNRLWQLPVGMAGCSSLRLLDCSHNLLSRLPAGMGKLVRLRSLKLTHNKLAWLPVAELQQLPGLVELHVAGNTFMVSMLAQHGCHAPHVHGMYNWRWRPDPTRHPALLSSKPSARHDDSCACSTDSAQTRHA